MVWFDLEFGELTRRVALDGAELIAAPVNWPQFPRPDGEHVDLLADRRIDLY
jgi:5-aminopentanamidase